eukprot:ctg_1899.g570
MASGVDAATRRPPIRARHAAVGATVDRSPAPTPPTQRPGQMASGSVAAAGGCRPQQRAQRGIGHAGGAAGGGC